jgi:hypothetical protein
MFDEREPDPARLQQARKAVQTFLARKKLQARALFVATLVAEALFLGLMLLFMDFHQRQYWFQFFGFMLVYTPLILFSWHNSVKIEQLHYQLVEELKYDGPG